MYPIVGIIPVMSERYTIPNPFVDVDGYNCFACSPDNPIGLRLKFWRDGDRVYAQWTPHRNYQGYGGVLHGGIQATLVDEVGSWAIFALVGAAGLTTSMRINYAHSLPIDRGAVTASATIVATGRATCDVAATLTVEQRVTTTADMSYRLVPSGIAQRRFAFPGADAFRPAEEV